AGRAVAVQGAALARRPRRRRARRRRRPGAGPARDRSRRRRRGPLRQGRGGRPRSRALQVDPRLVPDLGARLRQPLAGAAPRPPPARARRGPVRMILPVPAPPAFRVDWDGLEDALAAAVDPAVLAATPQDAAYHAEGDVWVHTCMVVEALVADPDWRALPDEE